MGEFVRFLVDQGIRGGMALDLGCGRGRNTLFLAKSGFVTTGIDIVPELISGLNRQAEEQGLAGRVRAHCQSVTEPWPLGDSSIDVAVDTFCYKHQIEAAERARYRAELARDLRPGGFYMLTLAGDDDGYYGPLLARSPRKVARVITDPANGI